MTCGLCWPYLLIDSVDVSDHHCVLDSVQYLSSKVHQVAEFRLPNFKKCPGAILPDPFGVEDDPLPSSFPSLAFDFARGAPQSEPWVPLDTKILAMPLNNLDNLSWTSKFYHYLERCLRYKVAFLGLVFMDALFYSWHMLFVSDDGLLVSSHHTSDISRKTIRIFEIFHSTP